MFVNSINGWEAVLDGDCEDITQIMPPDRLAHEVNKCRDPFYITADEADLDSPHGCILPPPRATQMPVRIPTPLPGTQERLTVRPPRVR